MKNVIRVIAVALLVIGLSNADVPAGSTKTGAQLRQQQNTAGIVSAGTTGSFSNDVGAMAKVTFAEYILGAPTTSSIVISGCMRAPLGTAIAPICDVLETYATVANANRHPAITVLYDYFTVVPTFTGGASPTLTVNYTAAN